MKPPTCAAVIRLDALGDSLLSLPAVQALAQAWPQTRLVVVASPVGAPVFASCAEVWEAPAGVKPGELGQRLRQAGCQAVLVFTEKRFGVALASSSRAPIRVGFDPGLTQPLKTLWLRRALTHRVPWPNDPRRDPGMHEVERYLLLLRVLGLEVPAPPPLRLQPSEQDLEYAHQVLKEFPTRPVALQWMPRWTAGGWPETLPGEVLGLLPEPRIVLFAPGDRPQAEPWATQQQIPWVCVPEIGRYAALLAGCRALVTPDGGAVHVAAAVGTPVVDLFGERYAAHIVRRWHPWSVEHRIVLRGDYVPGAENTVKELAERLAASAEELCRSTSAS